MIGAVGAIAGEGQRPDAVRPWRELFRIRAIDMANTGAG